MVAALPFVPLKVGVVMTKRARTTTWNALQEIQLMMLSLMLTVVARVLHIALPRVEGATTLREKTIIWSAFLPDQAETLAPTSGTGNNWRVKHAHSKTSIKCSMASLHAQSAKRNARIAISFHGVDRFSSVVLAPLVAPVACASCWVFVRMLGQMLVGTITSSIERS